LFHEVISSLNNRYSTNIITPKLRGSLVVKSIESSLALKLTLLRTSIPTSGSLVLLELLLSKSAGIILATRLRLQSLLETILGVRIVNTLLQVLAVRARLLDVLVVDIAGSRASQRLWSRAAGL
jgi:hypothetical protein